VESQFLNNQEQRAILLDTEFRTFVQGDLSISDYCRHLQTMADALRGFGEDIPDRTFVLNVIHGLNEKFAPIGIHLHYAKSFPTFLEPAPSSSSRNSPWASRLETPPPLSSPLHQVAPGRPVVMATPVVTMATTIALSILLAPTILAVRAVVL
jgi:hypothetical protein